MNSYQLAQSKGMLSKEEVGLLKVCAAELPTRPVIINIGAGVGTSALAILEERPQGFIFSIDTKPKHEEKEALRKGAVDPNRVVRILGKSWNVGLHFPWSVDLVFVDGDHTNAGVNHDLQTFLPLVNNGGFILFHDYNHPNLPGLTKIVNHLMRGYEIVGHERYLIAYKVGK